MTKPSIIIAALLLAACDVADTAISTIEAATQRDEYENPCPPVLDCMTNACTYQANANDERAQGYVIGCVEACMGVVGVDDADRWVRGVAARAFEACELGADECEANVLACVEPE